MPCRCERAIVRHVTLSLLVLALAGATLAAQDAQSDRVFAPFVSQLRLSVRDPQIRVSWEDATDVITTYRIYRSTEPITNQTLDDAEHVGSVGPGDEAFIDIPPEPGSYHYAVLAENASGEPYPVLIPGRNASFRPVDIVNVATEAERAAKVRELAAAVVSAQGQDGVEITGVSSREGRTLAVYRATDPIASEADLASASLVREVPSDAVRIVDLPVPGVEYYYAAVDAALLIAGGLEIVPGENATIDPVEIPLRVSQESAPVEATATEPAPAGEADAATGEAATEPAAGPEPFVVEPIGESATRRIPLPFLQLQNQLASGRRLGDPRILIPERTELDPQSQAGVNALLSSLVDEQIPPPGPTILPEDRLPEPEGAEYTLRTILDGPFRRMAWESALEQFENYFTLPLGPELEARAHYYRAQVYHFLGDDRMAILEFLLARDRYYVEVEAWLDRILSAAGA